MGGMGVFIIHQPRPLSEERNGFIHLMQKSRRRRVCLSGTVDDVRCNFPN